MRPQTAGPIAPAGNVPRARHLATALAALLALAACADMPTAPEKLDIDLAMSPVEATGVWAEIRRGETGPGALFEIHVPRDWNGDVVYYGHGIRDVLEPVSLREQDAFFTVRDRLGALGYAVAWSSFSENGYAVKDGAQRIHQLRGLFASEFGQPRRSFLAGHSLGALVALNLAERFPSQYDGALPMCAPLGGTERQVDYVTNVRLLFDLFYPGVLRGTARDIPQGYVLGPADQQRIVQAIMANPAGLAVIASTAQTPLEFRYGPTMQTDLITSLINALTYHARGADNVLPLMNGQWPFDNTTTTYSPRPLPFPLVTPQQLAGALAFVNAAAPRLASDPSADEYEDRYYEPTGRLEIPVVTLHNRWDPLVPFFHEGVFAATVQSAGATSMLEQRVVEDFGHCRLPADDVVAAFQALVARAPLPVVAER